MLRLPTAIRTDILLRILVKGLLAAGGTKVVSLFFVFGDASRGRRVNIYVTYGVMYGHIYLLHRTY